MGDLPATQRAVREVPGVVHADLRWPDPHGPATLQVEIRVDDDPTTVAEQLAMALSGGQSVDLEALQITRVGDERGASRPSLSSLRIEWAGDRLAADVALRWHGHLHMGQAADDADTETLQVVGAATARALDSLVGHARFEVLDLRRMEIGPGPGHMTAVVEDRDHGNTTVGSAMIRRDPNDAAVRAVLDAVNRRLSITIDVRESA